MNEKQRESAAKFMYDVSKLIVALVVLAPLVDGINAQQIAVGLSAAAVFFGFGMRLDNG